MADKHSMDIVCKVEMHEVKNAVDQAKKQLAVRYDFKGSKSTITLNKDDTITLIADDDYKLKSLQRERSQQKHWILEKPKRLWEIP